MALKPSHPLNQSGMEKELSGRNVKVWPRGSLAILQVRVVRGRRESTVLGQWLGIDSPALPNTASVPAGPTGFDGLQLHEGNWLLFAQTDKSDVDQLSDELLDAGAALFDITPGYVVLRIQGRRSQHVLSFGTALDLHPRALPAGHMKRTKLAGVDCVIRAVAAGQSYDIFVPRSYAAGLWDWFSSEIRMRAA